MYIVLRKSRHLILSKILNFNLSWNIVNLRTTVYGWVSICKIIQVLSYLKIHRVADVNLCLFSRLHYSIFIHNDPNEKSINRYLAKSLLLKSFLWHEKLFNWIVTSSTYLEPNPIQKIIKLLSLQMSSVIRKFSIPFFGYNSVRIIFSHWIQSGYLLIIVINWMSHPVSYLETRFNEGQFSREQTIYFVYLELALFVISMLWSQIQNHMLMLSKVKHHVVDDANNILHSFCTKNLYQSTKYGNGVRD